MDPALASPPEIILDDRADYSQPGGLHCPHFSPLFSAGRCAPWEGPDNHKHVPQVSYEIFESEAFCPLGVHQIKMSHPALLKPPTVAEIFRNRLCCDQRDQLSVQHVLHSPTQPIQAQQSPLCHGFHTTSPPGAGVQPGMPSLPCSPCAPHDSSWMNMSPLSSPPCQGFCWCPCMLAPISSPSDVCSCAYLPPHPWLLKSKVHPRWCLCPQAVPVHQTCSPALDSRTRDNEQLNGNVTLESETIGEEAKTQGEQQRTVTPGVHELQENQPDHKLTEFKVSPGSSPAWEEQLVAFEAYADYKTIMDSLCPEIPGKDECDIREKGETGNFSFLEYLDELCSDEDFMTEVESILNTDQLNSLLSSDPDTIDIFDLGQQQEETTLRENSHLLPVSNGPVTVETSRPTSHGDQTLQRPVLDPPSIKTEPNHTGQTSPEKVGPKEARGTSSRPLPPHPQEDSTEATPEGHIFPPGEEHDSPALLNTCASVCHHCSFLKQKRFASHATQTENFSDSVNETAKPPRSEPAADLGAKAQGESERGCGENLETCAGAGETQKQESVAETWSTKVFEKEVDIKDIPKPPRLPSQSEKEEEKCSVVGAGERKPTEKNLAKTPEFTPKGDLGEKQRKYSRRRQLFKGEEGECKGQCSGTAEKEEQKELTGEMHKLQVYAGNPLHFCTEMGPNETCSSKTQGKERPEEGNQTSGFVRPRTRSIAAEERVQTTPTTRGRVKCSETKPSPKRELEINLQETTSEPQFLPAASPTKRSRRMRAEKTAGKAKVAKKDLTAHKAKISRNGGRPAQTQMKKESLRGAKNVPKGPREAALDDRCEAKHPTTRLRAQSAIRCGESPKSPPTLLPESNQKTPQQRTAVLETKTLGVKSKISKRQKKKLKKENF